MQTSLLRQLHMVQYRELTDLIGQVVTISSPVNIAEGVLPIAAKFLPSVHDLELNPGNLLPALAKYKLLDLSFALPQPVLSATDTITRNMLIELGFMNAEEEGPMGFVHSENEDTCIEDLVEGTRRGKHWLKLLLDVWPLRDALEEYITAIRPAERGPTFNDQGWARLLREAETMFPSEFRIRDACITNSNIVWVHKHFYM